MILLQKMEILMLLQMQLILNYRMVLVLLGPSGKKQANFGNKIATNTLMNVDLFQLVGLELQTVANFNVSM